MPNQPVIFLPNNYYHVYNRGANKENIFFSADNYSYCQKLIEKNVEKMDVTLVAYCLMPNHYHFLIRQDGQIPVSKFVQNLFDSYVQAVNKQQHRQGTLFGGKFKRKHVDKEEYLIYLCRYIHRNPVEAGLVSKPEEWDYSNYSEWIDLRDGDLVDEQFIKEYFDIPQLYSEFVGEDIDGNVEDALSEYYFD